MIHGVSIHPLAAHADERGYLMELLRESDPHFAGFGQVYVSKNFPGIIRAWHYHEEQTDTWAVVSGMIKVAMFDLREDSSTKGAVQEVFMGDDHRVILVIPRGVAHGYKTIGCAPSLLLNFSNIVYNPESPDEKRIPFDSPDIPYSWDVKIT